MRHGESEGSSSGAAPLDVSSVLVKSHRIGLYFGATAIDLEIPRCTGTRIDVTIEALQQLQRETCPVLRRQAERFSQHVGGCHVGILAEVPA